MNLDHTTNEFAELISDYTSALEHGGRKTFYFWTKRGLDIVGSVFLLVVLAPVLLAAAVAIKVDSRGPVFFRQDRVGSRRPDRRSGSWQRRTFRIYKFRSMFEDSDESLHKKYIEDFVNGSVEASLDGAKYKLNGDSRVTPVGRVLRRTSVDELPQLINVLKGEMSLVGPRPVPPYEVDGYMPWHHERLDAVPGITGTWQVYGRGRVTFEEMMRMDIEYVRSQSILLDLKLLILTIPAVFRGRGAG